MKENTTLFANDKNALLEALVDFYAMPGNYALSMGQPSLIFQNLDTVIAWALGKNTVAQEMQNPSLKQLAIFFIQRACFRQENTYYDVIRLGRQFSADTLRVRYRALISLTHPDKGVQGIAADAAVRINKAYEILKDDNKRAEYDASLAAELSLPSKLADSVSVSPLARKPSAVIASETRRPMILKFAVLAALIVFGGVIFAVIFGQSSSDLQLVERRLTVPKSLLPDPMDSMKSELSLPTSLVSSSVNVQTRAKSPQKNDVKLTAESNLYEWEEIARKRVRQGLNAERQASTAGKMSVATAFRQDAIKDADSEINKAYAVSAANNSLQNTSPSTTEVKRTNLPPNEARLLVSQLIAALGRPNEAESTQNRLIKQGVSGNLLGLALPHLRQSNAIRVEQPVFKELISGNHLVLSGSVALWMGSSNDQLTPYRYAIHAEFNDIERGIVLSNFDLKEAK